MPRWLQLAVFGFVIASAIAGILGTIILLLGGALVYVQTISEH